MSPKTRKELIQRLCCSSCDDLKSSLHNYPYPSISFLEECRKFCQERREKTKVKLIETRIRKLRKEHSERDHSQDDTFRFINASNRD